MIKPISLCLLKDNRTSYFIRKTITIANPPNLSSRNRHPPVKTIGLFAYPSFQKKAGKGLIQRSLKRATGDCQIPCRPSALCHCSRLFNKSLPEFAAHIPRQELALKRQQLALKYGLIPD